MGLRQILQKLRLAHRKAKEEAKTAKFLVLNTKNCPQCKATMEKEDGCDHMDCWCGHSFCWICMMPWGLQHHRPECIYRVPEFVLDDLAREQPKNQGLWLQEREMFIVQGEGIHVMNDLFGLEDDLWAIYGHRE